MFRPTNPNDRIGTIAELEDWRNQQKQIKREKIINEVHFWITSALSLVAIIISIITLITTQSN